MSMFKSWNWKRVGLLVAAGVCGILSPIVPPVAIALPIIGHLTLAAGLASAATFLGGWATTTPGHGPVVEPTVPGKN